MAEIIEGKLGATSLATASQAGDVLAACVPWVLGVRSSAGIAEATRVFQQWPRLLAAAEAHGLLPVVAGCFDSLGVQAPAWVLQALDRALRENARRVLVMSEELNGILRQFESAGVPALAVKGPVNAWTLYDDPAYRVFSDLDLLVPSACLSEAQRVLSVCGYRPSGPDRFPVGGEVSRLTEFAYENTQNGIHVDLHRELTPPDWFASLPPNLWQRTRTATVGGCPVRTLGEDDTFLYLCFHGAKHGWSSLNWLLDVASLALRSPGIGRNSLRLVDPKSKAAAMVQFGVAASAALAPGIPQFAEARTGIPERILALARAVVRKALSGETPDRTAWDRCRFQWNLGGSQLALSRYIVLWLFAPDRDLLQLIR